MIVSSDRDRVEERIGFRNIRVEGEDICLNGMPMITSRVCAHFCQGRCNRTSTDESVSVHSVERKVGDYILENLDRFYAPPGKATGKKIALVGAGPAGLTAAYYLRKAGHEVTVMDSMDEPGGCLTYAIPVYRLPKDYI